MKGLTSASEPALGRQRALRLLRASRLKDQESEASTVAFTLALLAVVLEFTVSGNTLSVLGISYDVPGGNPLVKFLPGTYMAVFAGLFSLVSGARRNRGVGHLLSKAPALVVFLGLTVFSAIYSAFNVGLTGAGVYLDTYLSAGFLAVAMLDANERQRALFARVVLSMCVLNVLISILESMRQDHFIPFEVNGIEDLDTLSGEFRPAALYTHPLTGAMGTAFGLFLCTEARLSFFRTAVIFGILFVGLLSFGGRAALVASVGLLLIRVAITMGRDLLHRRFNGPLLGALVISVGVLLPVASYLLVATPIGERIVSRSYYDDSAEVRADQWAVLKYLTPNQAMFGTPAVALEHVYTQVGLTGVENPLILMFLNLGIIGFPIFSVGLIAYFVYIYRTYPGSGWLLAAAVIILSGSNSVGTKSPDLFVMTACAVAMSTTRARQIVSHVRKSWSPTFRLSPLPAKGMAPDAQGLAARASTQSRPRGLSPKIPPRFGRPSHPTGATSS
jgi:hypothetical protein